MKPITFKDFWFLAMIAWAFSLAVAGCDRKPDPNHYTIVDKWDDEKVVLYGRDRHRLQLSRKEFDWVQVGDRVELDGSIVRIRRPIVQVIE